MDPAGGPPGYGMHVTMFPGGAEGGANEGNSRKDKNKPK